MIDQNSERIKRERSNIQKQKQARKPTHDILNDLSKNLLNESKKLSNQMIDLQKNMSSQSSGIIHEQIHDRLESLLLEQRATNMLLAKLVSYHESVMDPQNIRILNQNAEATRQDVYNRVLRGE